MNLAIFSTIGLIFIVKFFHIILGFVWAGLTVARVQGFSTVSSRWILVTSTLTLLTGGLHVAGYWHLSFYSSWGLSVIFGSAIGCLMWLNQFLKNKESLNLALLVPALFFMETASHLGIDVNPESDRWVLALSVAAPVVLLQAYSMLGKGPQLKGLRSSFAAGLLLLVIQYLAFEILSK